jgi:hypothetical protein
MPDFLDMIIFPIFKNKHNSFIFMKEGYDLLSVGPFRRNGNFIPSTLVFNTIVSRESVCFTFKAHVKLGTVLHEGWQ